MHHQTTQVSAQPGAPFEGGFYAGTVRIGADLFALIVAPANEGTVPGKWHAHSDTEVAGACSFSDGLANTDAMAAAGSDLAIAVRALAINDFTDWYIPARDELELCYRNLKPLARANYCGFRDGENLTSEPVGYPYTEQLPAQTAAGEFQQGGAQAFMPEWYWSSSQYAPGSRNAWGQDFGDGSQDDFVKGYAGRARAVRRFKI